MSVNPRRVRRGTIHPPFEKGPARLKGMRTSGELRSTRSRSRALALVRPGLSREARGRRAERLPGLPVRDDDVLLHPRGRSDQPLSGSGCTAGFGDERGPDDCRVHRGRVRSRVMGPTPWRRELGSVRGIPHRPRRGLPDLSAFTLLFICSNIPLNCDVSAPFDTSTGLACWLSPQPAMTPADRTAVTMADRGVLRTMSLLSGPPAGRARGKWQVTSGQRDELCLYLHLPLVTCLLPLLRFNTDPS